MPFTTFVYGHGASPQVACCTRRVFRSVARTDAPQGTRPSARRVTIVASGPFASQRALGVSPIELAQTHRLLLAKQLLTETSLPVTRVAFDSGFASVRRFNALFRSRYRLTPSDLRRSSPGRTLGESIRLTLSYRPPFAWNELLDFLAPRTMTGVEAIVGRTYV